MAWLECFAPVGASLSATESWTDGAVDYTTLVTRARSLIALDDQAMTRGTGVRRPRPQRGLCPRMPPAPGRPPRGAAARCQTPRHGTPRHGEAVAWVLFDLRPATEKRRFLRFCVNRPGGFAGRCGLDRCRGPAPLASGPAVEERDRCARWHCWDWSLFSPAAEQRWKQQQQQQQQRHARGSRRSSYGGPKAPTASQQSAANTAQNQLNNAVKASVNGQVANAASLPSLTDSLAGSLPNLIAIPGDPAATVGDQASLLGHRSAGLNQGCYSFTNSSITYNNCTISGSGFQRDAERQPHGQRQHRDLEPDRDLQLQLGNVSSNRELQLDGPAHRHRGHDCRPGPEQLQRTRRERLFINYDYQYTAGFDANHLPDLAVLHHRRNAGDSPHAQRHEQRGRGPGPRRRREVHLEPAAGSVTVAIGN